MTDITTSHTAILLVNTGSPESLEIKDVRAYLRRFLSDKRIIGLAAPLRYTLVYGLIAPGRAKLAREKYKKVWSQEGFILQVLSHRLAKRMEERSGITVRCAMRYERQSAERVLAELASLGKREVIVLPLFPHYARSSYETALVHIRDVARKHFGEKVTLHAAKPYYKHPAYIEALAQKIAGTISPESHLLFSFHGIPIHQVTPYIESPMHDYPRQCADTARLVMEHPTLSTRLVQPSYEICYQSRFGHHEWLSPYTVTRAAELGQGHHKQITVVCPSFVCDCLETIEEIGMEVRDEFRKSGGEELHLVPCLNDDSSTADALISICREHTAPIDSVLHPSAL